MKSFLAEEIRKYHNSSLDFLQTGFEYALKAGELLAEAESMVGAENLETWLQENKVNIQVYKVEELLKLFRGETIRVQVHTERKQEVNQEKES